MDARITQSIGVIATGWSTVVPAIQGRATQVSQQAGIQARDNHARANRSATTVSNDKDRAIDREGRAEGIFADQEASGEAHGSGIPVKRLNRTA